MRDLLLSAVLATALAGFGFAAAGHAEDKPAITEPDASDTTPRQQSENIISYHPSDEEMNAAMVKGQQTLGRFHELIGAGVEGTYSVKFPLTLNGQTEFIWMQLTDYEDGKYVGLLANDPVNGDEYKYGDVMKIPPADVKDWMIRTGTEIYGGHTIRVMLKAMPKDQADQFRAMLRD